MTKPHPKCPTCEGTGRMEVRGFDAITKEPRTEWCDCWCVLNAEVQADRREERDEGWDY